MAERRLHAWLDLESARAERTRDAPGPQRAGFASPPTDRRGGSIEAIKALFRGRRPGPDEVAQAVEGLDDDARRQLGSDRAFMDQLVAALPAAALGRVLQALFDDPEWALYYYACRKGGRDPAVVRQMLAGTGVPQRLAIIGWPELGQRLQAIVGAAHPDQLFGADLGRAIEQDPSLAEQVARTAPWFFDWRLRRGAVDLPGLLARMAQSREAVRAGLAGHPPALERLLAAAPAGAALPTAGRAALDRLALQFGSTLSVSQLEQAFAVRFGHPVGVDAAEVAGFRRDHEHLLSLWATLAPISPDCISPALIRELAQLDAAGGTYGGWAGAMLTGAHDPMPEKTTDQDTPGEGGGQPAEVEPRADLTDALAERDGQVWRAARARDAVLDAFVEACGGDTELRVAAARWMDDPRVAGADERWRRAVAAAADRGALAADPEHVVHALPALLRQIAPPAPARAGGLPAWLAHRGAGRVTGDPESSG